MPLATSDFRKPVCLEMKHLAAEGAMERAQHILIPIGNFSEVDMVPTKKTNGGDLASMDSSDTFASCATHPFTSQGDLASDILEPTSIVFDSNLYVNPLDKSTDNSPTAQPPPVPPPPQRMPTVKKSASGDTALRSLGASPDDEQGSFGAFGQIIDRGSRVSLNDSPGPKHRKTRFQSSRPRTRFGEAQKQDSQESLDKRKKISLIPSRGLASATRILNQHLFGYNLGGSRAGKNGGSKSSLSVDSMDSRGTTSPQLEHHRKSKSILKKADSGGSGRGREIDPESERLISDNGSGVFDMGPDYSPSPPPSRLSLRTRSSKSQSTAYQQELERNRTLKSQLFLLDDIMNKDGENIRKGIPSAEVNQVPLYICPPPPPMDEANYSPTEETQLLSGLGSFGATSTPPVSCRHPNSISKGHTHPSA
ncbi:uncharacterized protein LOC115885220 [Sitophilus oryzae]|uniref:Uncharacterized protein LOC115885220 n=1 Tax=Sitophilus oryzae TaxID=7048 RepID=A0A6J2YAF6_SITOR|nr:uncharacterized protein LOC115885220 [Sitophilus oryzae]